MDVSGHAGSVLLVGGTADDVRALSRSLSEFEIVCARRGCDALDQLALRPVDLVLTLSNLPDMPGITFLKLCREKHPKTLRALWAPVETLLAVTQAANDPGLAHPLPHSEDVYDLRERIVNLVASRHADKDWRVASALLAWTGTQLAQISGRVLRAIPRSGEAQIQLVIPAGAAFESLREEIRRRWGAPIKARDTRAPAVSRSHPVLRYTRRLLANQEAYARKVDSKDLHVFLVLLPWRREPRVTAILGICSTKAESEHRDFVRELHTRIVVQLSQLYVPNPDGSSSHAVVRYIKEYDFVATPNYVGADRRLAPLSFVNSYTFLGRRRVVPKNLAEIADLVIDRFTPRTLAFFSAYLALSAIDTYFTYRYVRGGMFAEANPILDRLMRGNGVLFVAGKNVAALLGFAIVSRLQLIRAARFVIPLMIGAYAALDVYWFWLLSRR